jgi:predicted Zn finger-like uncharacterized protein
MILTCPTCATRYLVDADQLWTIGRTVQCDACGQRWRAAGSGRRPAPATSPLVPMPEPGPEATPEPAHPIAEPSPADEPPMAETATETKFPPVPGFKPLGQPTANTAAAEPAFFLQRPKRPTRAGYGPPGLGRAMAILFMLGMVLMVLVLFQDVIVRAAPSLAPVYSALGLSGLNVGGAGAHG